MKKVLLIAFVLALAVPYAASGAELKIAYVDFNKALNESEKGKKATAELEALIQSKKLILVEKDKEIKTLDEELKKQASVLSPEARSEKEEALKKLLRDVQRMRSDFQEEIKKKEASLTQEIQNEIIAVIDEIAKNEGYTIVFERGVSGILYFQTSYDITEKVITQYNGTPAKQ